MAEEPKRIRKLLVRRGGVEYHDILMKDLLIGDRFMIIGDSKEDKYWREVLAAPVQNDDGTWVVNCLITKH